MAAIYEALMTAYEVQNWPEAVALGQKILHHHGQKINKDTYYLLLGISIDSNNVDFACEVAEKFQAEYVVREDRDFFYLGRVAYLTGDWASAEKFFRQALADDKFIGWYRGATESIYATWQRELGNPAVAVEHYRRAGEYKSMAQGRLTEYSNMLFNMQYLDITETEKMVAARKYGEMLANLPHYRHPRKRRHKKLRIGYLSPDLRFHVVAFFSFTMFMAYDKERFEVYCYTNCIEDSVSCGIARQVDGWRNVRGEKAETVAARIYADEIDILFDLAGHTAHSMLPVLAYKPAPMQICGIGYFATTGLPAVDYFLVDRYTALPEEAGNFVEKLLYMEKSHFCYTWHEVELPHTLLPCLQNGYITFGSLNNFTKVNDRVLSAWGQILAALPDSRLYLQGKIFNNAYGRQKAQEHLRSAGIPVERVQMVGFDGTSNYLRAYEKIDIALDTFPYPGGGTTCDALYMGVPVITLVGQSHNSRFGYSLLMNVGQEDCCAFSEQEYVEKAVNQALDIPRLQILRQNLREDFRRSPVMQGADYMRELEKNYIRIYGKFLAGL